MSGVVVRVSGSLVELEGLPGVSMNDLVAIGDRGLSGEVVAIDEGRVAVQAYEDTRGLAPGAVVESTGLPLSAALGPGLLGGVFDGLLRPLSTRGEWLRPGMSADMRDSRTWSFTPSVSAGDAVTAGGELGRVTDAGVLPFLVLVPANVSGDVEFIAASGAYSADAEVAKVGGVSVSLTARWPLRLPRPYHERITAAGPLHTGQRVIDLLYPIATGSTAAVPGGFGTGKTVLLQQIAKWCDADLIVYVGCGERGNEMADVVDDLGQLVDQGPGTA